MPSSDCKGWSQNLTLLDFANILTNVDRGWRRQWERRWSLAMLDFWDRPLRSRCAHAVYGVSVNITWLLQNHNPQHSKTSVINIQKSG